MFDANSEFAHPYGRPESCIDKSVHTYISAYISSLQVPSGTHTLNIMRTYTYCRYTVTATVTGDLLNTKVLSLVSRRLSQPVQSPTYIHTHIYAPGHHFEERSRSGYSVLALGENKAQNALYARFMRVVQVVLSLVTTKKISTLRGICVHVYVNHRFRV